MDKQNIETIYPLAPLQQAFLWHSLQESSQAGLLHVRCTLRGQLDLDRFRQAWGWVVNRHQILRASVHWEGIKHPLQVIARKVQLPWLSLDWRDKKDDLTALTNFLAEDGDRGFNLTQSPIMRLTLIQQQEQKWEFIWTCHHLMLDGWSCALALEEVWDIYEKLEQNQPLPGSPVLTYQAYLRWLKQQDQASAARFWQERLDGFAAPTPLPTKTSFLSSLTPSLAQNQKQLSVEQTISLDISAFLTSQQLTLTTLMQGLWALLLYHHSSQTDILFGLTVSGRQVDLPGVETVVGLLINVLPVRVQILPDEPILTWLQRLQTQQINANPYSYASLDQIQAWSRQPGRLFNSLLVIENYPVLEPVSERSIKVENFQSGVVSTYALALMIKPGKPLTLSLRADSEQFEAETLKNLLFQFQSLLNLIIENPLQTLRDVLPSPEQAKGNKRNNLSVASRTTPVTEADLSRETLETNLATARNALELELIQIWESVLGVRPLSVEASFFELDGNSLMAIRLFNQMQQQLNCTLPLASLFKAPNVRQFAELLTQAQPVSSWSSLVPIQPSGSWQPFFFHGGSADALTWVRFSHLLGVEQPFYALQRPDLDGTEIVHTSVEVLAATCIEEMRTVQPKGPYLVGGHCFGGAIAIEIAQQLQAQGEDITSVILIDAYCPEPIPQTPLVKLQNRLQLLFFWLRKNYYYYGGWKNLGQLSRKIWQRLRRQNHPSPRDDNAGEENMMIPPSYNSQATQTTVAHLPYEYRYARAQEANEIAHENYSPQPYSGQVKLFRAEIQILDWYFGSSLGWQKIAKKQVDITNIPGFFGNLFNQKSAPILADEIKKYLSTL